MHKAIKIILFAAITILAVVVCLSATKWLPWGIAKSGDSSLVLFSRTVADDNLRAGSEVAFNTSAGKTVLVARVYRVSKEAGLDNYLLKADLTDKQYLVGRANILGLAGPHIPLAGMAYSLITSWPGMVAGLYIPVVALIGYEINRLARHLANYATD